MGARAYGPAGGWVNPRATKAESSAGTARRAALVGVCWLFCQGVRSAAALMIRLNDILEKVSAYHADADLDLIKKAYVYSAKVHQGENFRKMLVAMAKDIRVILVKLADRTHNMRTLEHMRPDAQQRIAQETLDIYAPLANRLGIQWVKIELEDLAFKYLKPAEYADVETQLAQSQKDRQRFIADVVELLQTKLREAGLLAEVHGRPKHVYSIWKKMRKNGLS